MAVYEIFFRESVWKELKKVPRADLKKILSRIGQLGNDPRPVGCEKLTGQELVPCQLSNAG
jgi:mRNA interferase RelE/StbE